MDNFVECPKCGVRNRIHGDGEKLPVCGKCKASLPWIVSGTDANFGSETHGPVPVLVDFWAEWCGPCRVISPILEQLAREKAGSVKILKMNVDQNPVTAGELRVQSIPTMMLFKDGRVVETVIGAMPKNELLRRFGAHLS
jgi:thioredoxin 2